MFGISDININTSMCSGGDRGLQRLATVTKEIFTKLVEGSGTILRFELTAAITPGGSATATIERFEGGAFVSVGTGTVHDEEIGGFWEADAGEGGWCTARDGQADHYSIVIIPRALTQAIINYFLDGGEDPEPLPGIFHRGITTSLIAKGGSGTVSRYSPGTDSGSGIVDTVLSDLATVASGRKVHYMLNGNNFYIVAVERFEQEVMLDMRINGSDTYVEANTLLTQVETVSDEEWEDKLPLTGCPEV